MSEQLNRLEPRLRSVERFLDNFKKLGRNNLTAAKVKTRISALRDMWTQVQDGHAALLDATSLAARGKMVYFTENRLDAVEEIYLSTLDHMADVLAELEPSTSLSRDTSNSVPYRPSPSSLSISQLPAIALPTFDGDLNDWESFRDQFEALIVQSTDLKDFARMHFLVSSLKGRARDCIRDLPVTAASFTVAWNTLRSRYEDTQRLLNLHFSTLLSLPILTRESANDLQSLRDRVNIAVASLNSLERSPAELWDDTLVHLVTRSLDPGTRKAWKLRTTDSDGSPSFEIMNKFLAARTRALEEPRPNATEKLGKKTLPIRSVNAATTSASTTPPCPVCAAPHFLNVCPAFVRATPSQRRDLVKEHRRCFNCLSQKHAVNECKSKYTCRTCHQRHHSMLHTSSGPRIQSDESSAHKSKIASDNGEVTSLFASAKFNRHPRTILATAWVSVRGADGRAVIARALLDQGSEISFISEHLAQLLRLKRFKMPTSVSAIGGVHAGTFRSAAAFTIAPRDSSFPSLETSALILKSLTSYTPKHVKELASLSHLKAIPWAGSDPTSTEPISLLIGVELFGEILLEGLRKGARGTPIAQNSIFGWLIFGALYSPRSSSQPRGQDEFEVPRNDDRTALHCFAPSLNSEIQRFWEVEEIPSPPIAKPEDQQCEKHFLSTHRRSQSGRYIVRLPFRRDPPIDIGDSRVNAETQLNRSILRMTKRPERLNEYRDFLQEYLQLGHMRIAFSSEPKTAKCVYLPHHPVYRESSETSRLRVVFNASSVTTNGSSLNDHLLTGPKLQAHLPAVILRWRQFRFVYSADIAKMYRQIRVDKRDLNYQRILWKESANAPVNEYQLLTVTYGMSCAPFLALRVLQQLSIDDGTYFPLAVPVLADHIYVDDVLFGHDDISALRETRAQLISLLSRGGFNLRKWASNSTELLADISDADHGLAGCRSLSGTEGVNILGIFWNPVQDESSYKLSLEETPPASKRSILSAIARLYDPLGWVSPVIIAAKILIQQLWKQGISWDDPAPECILKRWKQLYVSFSRLKEVRIPRWSGFGSEVQAGLVGFADASSMAYAAVVYLRVITSSDQVIITLISSRSRVAPLRPVSIPRLELLGAVLLARLIEFVRDALSLKIPCLCWTDSTVALTWIQQHPSRWKTFVANRVADIQRRLPDGQWRHVPTDNNPADCASRGMTGDELIENTLWWQGPSWLKTPPNQWPSTRTESPDCESLEERPTVSLFSKMTPAWELASRFSSWPILVRVTAYVLRFVSLCRRQGSIQRDPDEVGVALTVSECRAARSFWLKRIQAEVFPSELQSLSKSKVGALNPAFLSLRPFIDRDGLLRVGGRLKHAPSPFAVRNPILLAAHPLVERIIDNAHLRALHAGLQLTLSTLRRDFWILRARSLVKARIYRCIPCTRERAAVPAQLMGDLPANRITAPLRSFIHCGVDYAGPISIRASAGRGISSRKAYIAVFVCLASRAVHLELVSDYSTSAFLNAYSRFCARRGLPQTIYSDNGTTFVGASRELAAAYRATTRDPLVKNKLLNDEVTWRFIPPAAPHFGGLWEAGVKSVKHHLRRVLGDRTLSFEEFSTLLCRIEACLNSRPIAPLSDALNDFECLTPGHFLIGSALTVSPEPSLLDVNENRLSRWQLLRHMTERFWRLWRDDYVNTLQQRSKWRREKPSLRENQLVLLRSSNLPPCKWELGRITRCHPGPDGLVRVVTVRTVKSEFTRPIGKLCVLPVDCESTPPVASESSASH